MDTEQDREETGLINATLAFLANFSSRHPWWVLAATMLTCAASLITSVLMLKFHTQRNDLISAGKDYVQRWQQYVNEFGDDDDMVVVVKGADRKQIESALEDLAAQVSQQPDLFDRLFYKVDLRHLSNRKLLFLPSESALPVVRGEDAFFKQWAALCQGAGDFLREPSSYRNPWIPIGKGEDPSDRGSIRQIQEKLGEFSLLVATPFVSGVDRTFAYRLLTLQHIMDEAKHRVARVKAVGRDEAQGPARLKDVDKDLPSMSRNDREDIFKEPHFFFSRDGKLATLLVRPMKELDGFTFAQKSIDGLRSILAETQPRFPNLKFGLTGLPVLENDEMIASQSDSNKASWLALIGVAALYLVVYRGFRYPLMTVATLLVGTAWALGWMTLTVGHLNILSSAFAVMLIGMGDYGVLWVTRFGQERQGGATLPEAITRTAVSVGPGILTAALTTALAFFATMLADLKAVAELGWIAGCGVLFCALSCFIVMPALLALFDVRFKKKTDDDEDAAILSLAEAQQASRQWLPRLTHHPRFIIPICLGLTLMLAYVAKEITYDHNLLHMQDQGLESVRWEMDLIDSMPGTSWHALSYTNTPEEARDMKRQFELRRDEVGEVRCVADLVPPDQERKLDQLRDIQKTLRLLPERGKVIPHSRVDARLIADNARLLLVNIESLDGAAVETLRKSLRHLIASIEAAGDRAGTGLQEYEQKFTLSLIDDLHMLRDMSNPVPLTAADLPQSLRERYIGKNGKWLLRIFAKKDLWEYENLEKFVDCVKKIDADSTGKPFSTLEGLRAMKDGFFWAGIYAFIAMVIVLLLDFGNCKHTVIALAPLLMGLIATLGLMVICKITLNPANMIAFPLVLGVGADNGVHVLHDYRTRPRDRRYSLSFATGWGIMVAALTTILGFCTLIISRHRGLKSLGEVLTLGVTCCMLTALVFLPALLRLVSQRSNSRGQGRVEAAALKRRSA